MNKPTSSTTNKLFFRLPLESGSVKLTLKTLNRHSDFRRPEKPYLRIDIRKIYFRNEVLTIGVKLNGEFEERVFIRVKEKELLISCTVDTDETYLSRYAYFGLIEMMWVKDFYNFEEFYWPDFFDRKTGKSKYLDIVNDRSGMDILLKPKYVNFYKPGHKLVSPNDSEIIPRAHLIREEVNVDLENGYAIGYCLADTNLHSLHSNHFPLLVPYCGIPTKNRDAIKSFQKFILRPETELPISFTPLQVRLNEICFKMLEIASITSSRFRSSPEEMEQIKKDNDDAGINVFHLWQGAITLVNSQLYTHYHFTYGIANLSRKPRKKHIEVCKFSMEIPKLCFFRFDKGDYYEIHLRFRIRNRTFVPYESSTSFFLSPKINPMTFYLLGNLSDYKIASFFAKHSFKLAVLKVHYKNEFKDFMDQLAEFYEVK